MKTDSPLEGWRKIIVFFGCLIIAGGAEYLGHTAFSQTVLGFGAAAFAALVADKYVSEKRK